MNIRKLFDEKEFVFSFEIFPPKSTSAVESIYKTLEELKELKPDFISVTYGAGGSLAQNKTCELSSLAKNKHGIEALAHLTCINSSKAQINKILDELKENGVRNILALRGDIPPDANLQGDFRYASDLIEYINRRDDFNIVAACYPEGHMDAKSLKEDIKILKQKELAGASHFISQLFFDNNYFYEFLDQKEKYNIKVPIQAGIMPVINATQIRRIVSLCGAKVPEKFMKIMNRYENNKEALREAGIAYAVEQIIDLTTSGVDGIHLYTMNNPYVAKRITENIKTIRKTINIL